MSKYYSLRVGELVGKTFSVYFRNIVPFTLLSVVCLAPWVACRMWMLESSLADVPDPTMVLVAAIAVMLLQFVLTYFVTGAVTFGVIQHMRGEPAPFGAIMHRGLRSFGGVLLTSLVCGIRVLIGFLLLIVPGIIEAIRLYAAIPVTVLEGKTGNTAARRSIELTVGSRGSIFGTMLVFFLINMGFGIVGGAVLAIVALATPHAMLWFEVVMALVTVPLSATAMAVCYALLRRGKEQVDAQELAAVFA